MIISLDPLANGTELPGTSKKDLLNAIAAEKGIQVHYMGDVEALGEASPMPYHAPKPEYIVTINYTSGTTGNPKGVTLTHSNAVAAASASLCIAEQRNNDIICSYLPLAHIFQRVRSNYWVEGRLETRGRHVDSRWIESPFLPFHSLFETYADPSTHLFR